MQKKVVLFVSQRPIIGVRDGTIQYMTNVFEQLKDKYNFYMLFPICTKNRGAYLSTFQEAITKPPGFLLSKNCKPLEKVLEEIEIQIEYVHIQHLRCFSHTVADQLLEWCQTRKIPIFTTVHDINVIFDCSDGFVTQNQILHEIAPLLNNETKKLYEKLFSQSRAVICPSVYLKRLMEKHYSTTWFIFHPHETMICEEFVAENRKTLPENNSNILRIALCGNFVKHKGSGVFCETLTELSCRNHRRRFEFHVFGNVWDQISFSVCQKQATFHGSFNGEAELLSLLSKFKIDVIWFPNQTPESYCFVLSTALKSGLPIVLPKIGAFTERGESRDLVEWNDNCLSGIYWADFWQCYCIPATAVAKVSLTSAESAILYDAFVR